MSEHATGLVAACFGVDPAIDGWPSVSVVIPVRNEGPCLEAAVASILAQRYPGALDVCLAVAPSDDDTDAVAEQIIGASGGRVRRVDNPAGVTPAGLNEAIGATIGSVIVRVDGHAALSDGYIRRAVETMCRTGAVNVGGRQVPSPETPFEEAVAAAMTSWMGTGGATYRVGGSEGPVDTVYLGVFDRAAGDAVGWFDETLIRNQDYELNIRLRAAGGVVWFDPELAVQYRPRGSWGALARQYYEYGWWKAEVLGRYPETLRFRQALPAAIAPTLLVSIVLGRRRHLFGLVPAGYALLIGAACGIRRAPVLAVVHQAWSLGFGRRAGAAVLASVAKRLSSR